MFQHVEYRRLMRVFVEDPFNQEVNFDLGLLYDEAGHNAGAASFYIRAAEFGRDQDTLLVYESLLRLSAVLDRQRHRMFSARGSLLRAIALKPKRPEAYFLLSRFYERLPEYEDAYFIACMGLAHAEFDGEPLRTDVQYPGSYGLLFEKSVAAWWIGLKDESLDGFRALNRVELDPQHRQAVENNLRQMGWGHEVVSSSSVPAGKLFFDVGANRGEATGVALSAGYEKVVAFEPGPRILELLKQNYGNDERVVISSLAVSDTDGETVRFYEADEDGLSTLNPDWLMGGDSRYYGKPFREIEAETATLDTLIGEYGLPDLIKIDVEGAEDWVLRGLTLKPENLAFEWHVEELPKVFTMLQRLRDVNGYSQYALQYITHHLRAPVEYRPLEEITLESLFAWHLEAKGPWESGGWQEAGGLRPTADAGMMWVR